MTNNIYPVHNDSGGHLILNPPVNPPGGWHAGILYTASPAQAERGLMIRFGSASFSGNGSGLITIGVGHGLGRAPAWVDVLPSLYSGGGWTGQAGQYQAADNNAFYIVFTAPSSGTFLSGNQYFFNWLACAFVT